jgi:outer membrane protein assembly factor BamE (lipoprotein component of BamABCDE complex)
MKNKNFLLQAALASAVFSLTLGGCYSPGLPVAPANSESGSAQLAYQSHPSLERILIRGKTTRQEVIELLGRPDSDQNALDGSVMVYSYKKEEYGFFYHSTSKTLYIYFNQSGTIRDFTFQEFSV